MKASDFNSLFNANLRTAQLDSVGDKVLGIMRLGASQNFPLNQVPASSGPIIQETMIGQAGLIAPIGFVDADAIGSDQLADGAIDSASKFAASIVPPQVVSSLPALPDANYPNDTLVMLTSDHKLYRNAAGTWTTSVDGADILANSITAGEIAAGAIGTAALAANAVTAAKIAAGAITVLDNGNGVQITPTGIEVDGDLSTIDFKDSFGSTFFSGAGLGDQYWDAIYGGVFNGNFSRAVPGTPGVADGWTLNQPVGGLSALSVVGGLANPTGLGIRYASTGIDMNQAVVYSSLMPAIGIGRYFVAVNVKFHPFASLQAAMQMREYDASQSFLSETSTPWTTITGDASMLLADIQLSSSTRYYQIGMFMRSPTGASAIDIVAAAVSFQPTFWSFVPSGAIMLWSGSTTTIPDGWVLCDGTNGTPDLRDKFVVGLSSGSPVTGGSISPTAGHTHTNPNTAGSGTLTSSLGGSATTSSPITPSGTAALNHSHTVASHAHTVGATGTSSSYKYYELAYIMKQ